jgi:DNA-binding response OmpR family regulator
MDPKAQRRILVADDDPGIQRALTGILARAGFTVVQAWTGAEAIRLWRDVGADLLFIDVLMPEQDGIETIAELLAVDPGVRIIAMSGAGRINPRLDLLGDAEMLGAVGILEKPFTLDEVLAAVRAALPPEEK